MIAFDDMIAQTLNNKKFNPTVSKLFIRGRKLNISLLFITQSYFMENVKFNTLFCYENSRQKRASTNRI